MKKILLIGLVLMLIFLTSVLLISSFGLIESFSQKSEFPYTHSHTKAICDEQNLCQDYEIFCENKDVIYIIPITGAVVQFGEDWQDLRSAEMRNGFC
jgi:hypothetical protein